MQRGDRYHIQWWEEGKPQRVPTGTTDRGEAQRFLAQFIAGHGTPEPPQAPTIGQIITGYLADRKLVARAYDTLEVAAKALRRHLADRRPDGAVFIYTSGAAYRATAWSPGNLGLGCPGARLALHMLVALLMGERRSGQR
ncbi:MAG TPA: hypothetical protein VMB73_01975 [Acetobacteraceae bacterium]|nr:hypothetical protein [Acetobacteraceae bacterium]